MKNSHHKKEEMAFLTGSRRNIQRAQNNSTQIGYANESMCKRARTTVSLNNTSRCQAMCVCVSYCLLFLFGVRSAITAKHM